MTTLLTDLGANRDEVMRAMLNCEEMRRKAMKKKREAETVLVCCADGLVESPLQCLCSHYWTRPAALVWSELC